MSNAIFPTLAGLSWDTTKTPNFSTKIMTAISGKELRAAFMSYPIWGFDMSYTLLRDDTANNELQQLAGFFLARNGSFDNFLYTDASDSSVTGQNFGSGNGSATGFQLVRSYGGFTEPVMNLNGNPAIFVDGVQKTLTTDYSINSLGFVTFVVAPASGAALTWTGPYYFRARFAKDASQYNQFMKNLWELKKLELKACLGNKI